eukprot:GHVH01005861.1.p2 GENE.GHVH01005861.1~~GHVH01005861.1.p2  ORF type:complete len:359 (-),score=52.24 GHVH01005861.1:740-1816(-)
MSLPESGSSEARILGTVVINEVGDGGDGGTPSTVADTEDECNSVNYELLGTDYLLDDTMTELHIHTGRLKELSNLEQAPNLKSIVIVASLVQRLSGLENLTKLEHLELYQAKIRRIENIEHLTELRTLDLSFNGIRDVVNLRSLTKLEQLYLPSNKIETVNQEEIAPLTQLKLLELGANRLREVPQLEGLTNLTQLWLGKNKLSSMMIPLLPCLRVLDMRSNRLVDWDPAILNLPALEELYLSHNQIIDPPDENYFQDKLQSLTILDISANAVTSVKPFLHLTNLKELYIHECKLLDEKELSLLKVFHQLDTLYMASNPMCRNLGPMYRNRVIECCADTLLELDGNDVQRSNIVEEIN